MAKQRVNGENGNNRYGNVDLQFIPQRAMQGVNNPFAMSLANETSSINGTLEFSVSCQTPVTCQLLWGAMIKDIHYKIYQDTLTFQDQLETGLLDEEQCTEISEKLKFSACKNHIVKIKPPLTIQDPNALGDPPRPRYPLVAIMSPQKEYHSDNEQSIVAMVTVVHIRDSVCPTNSHIIAQYVKLNTGHVYNLKQLFVATDSQNTGVYSSSTRSQSSHSSSHSPRNQSSSSNQHSEDNEPHSTLSDKHSVPPNDEIKNDDGEKHNTRDISSPSNNSDIPGLMEDASNERNENSDNLTEHDCVVCQNAGINRVILPCRHACVCDNCFPRLDRCPMCRNYIESYFILEDQVKDMPENDGFENLTVGERLVQWNHRLNETLGFE